MAITAEWILNKSKKKIYAITHAKAVIRGTSTLDSDMLTLENNIVAFQAAVNALQTEVNSLDLTTVNAHLNKLLTTEAGAHGLRYFNDILQFWNGTAWIEIETGAGGIPPASMKSVSAGYGPDGTKAVLRGTDPDDIVVDGNVLVRWGGTKIVRKVGSYPTKVNDGVLVVDYQTRNQFSSNGYTDTGLVNGETYYYRWFTYSDVGVVNMSDIGNVDKVTTKAYTVVGVKSDWSNNTFTRLESAIGLTAGANFNQFNMFGKRRRCIVADDRIILAFHGETGYTETGITTIAIAKNGKTYPSGTSVQVMVYQPKFYYKVTPVNKVANPHGTGFMIKSAEYYVSDVLYAGFKVHPAFKRNGVELPYILLSAFEASTQNSNNTYVTTNASLGNRLSSIAGAKPATGSDGSNTHNFTRAIARGLAATRGTGWQIGDALSAAASQLLMMIEYASMNSQTVIGLGNVNNTGSYARVVVTGGTSSLVNNSGNAAGGTNGTCCVSYRGEENLWGNVWTWQDGLNTYNSNTGISYWADHGFADDISANPYQSTGFTNARANNYVSAFGYSDVCDFLFLPAECLGDSANPVGDYFYQNYSSSSMTVAALGGSCYYGAITGLFCWDVDSASSSSNWHVGSRLVCVPPNNAVAL